VKNDLGFCFAIYDKFMEPITFVNTYHTNTMLEDIGIGNYNVSFAIPKYLLNENTYFINIHINDSKGYIIKILEKVIKFSIIDDNYRRGDTYYGEWPGLISLVPNFTLSKK